MKCELFEMEFEVHRELRESVANQLEATFNKQLADGDKDEAYETLKKLMQYRLIDQDDPRLERKYMRKTFKSQDEFDYKFEHMGLNWIYDLRLRCCDKAITKYMYGDLKQLTHFSCDTIPHWGKRVEFGREGDIVISSSSRKVRVSLNNTVGTFKRAFKQFTNFLTNDGIDTSGPAPSVITVGRFRNKNQRIKLEDGSVVYPSDFLYDIEVLVNNGAYAFYTAEILGDDINYSNRQSAYILVKPSVVDGEKTYTMYLFIDGISVANSWIPLKDYILGLRDAMQNILSDLGNPAKSSVYNLATLKFANELQQSMIAESNRKQEYHDETFNEDGSLKNPPDTNLDVAGVEDTSTPTEGDKVELPASTQDYPVCGDDGTDSTSVATIEPSEITVDPLNPIETLDNVASSSDWEDKVIEKVDATMQSDDAPVKLSKSQKKRNKKQREATSEYDYDDDFEDRRAYEKSKRSKNKRSSRGGEDYMLE